MGVTNLNRKLIKVARNLRKESTNTERFLWRHLRRHQLADLKFRRQQPIGRYVVDFVCFERHIIVEVDGGQHQENKDKDITRDIWLESQGFRVLRFWDNEVLTNIQGVLEMIRESCCSATPSPLSPPIQGGEIKEVLRSATERQERSLPSIHGREVRRLI